MYAMPSQRPPMANITAQANNQQNQQQQAVVSSACVRTSSTGTSSSRLSGGDHHVGAATPVRPLNQHELHAAHGGVLPSPYLLDTVKRRRGTEDSPATTFSRWRAAQVEAHNINSKGSAPLPTAVSALHHPPHSHGNHQEPSRLGGPTRKATAAPSTAASAAVTDDPTLLRVWPPMPSPHFCPICMLYYPAAYETCCCQQTLCEGCGTAMVRQAMTKSALFRMVIKDELVQRHQPAIVARFQHVASTTTAHQQQQNITPKEGKIKAKALPTAPTLPSTAMPALAPKALLAMCHAAVEEAVLERISIAILLLHPSAEDDRPENAKNSNCNSTTASATSSATAGGPLPSIFSRPASSLTTVNSSDTTTTTTAGSTLFTSSSNLLATHVALAAQGDPKILMRALVDDLLTALMRTAQHHHISGASTGSSTSANIVPGTDRSIAAFLNLLVGVCCPFCSRSRLRVQYCVATAPQAPIPISLLPSVCMHGEDAACVAQQDQGQEEDATEEEGDAAVPPPRSLLRSFSSSSSQSDSAMSKSGSSCSCSECAADDHDANNSDPILTNNAVDAAPSDQAYTAEPPAPPPPSASTAEGASESDQQQPRPRLSFSRRLASLLQTANNSNNSAASSTTTPGRGDGEDVGSPLSADSHRGGQMSDEGSSPSGSLSFSLLSPAPLRGGERTGADDGSSSAGGNSHSNSSSSRRRREEAYHNETRSPSALLGDTPPPLSAYCPPHSRRDDDDSIIPASASLSPAPRHRSVPPMTNGHTNSNSTSTVNTARSASGTATRLPPMATPSPSRRVGAYVRGGVAGAASRSRGGSAASSRSVSQPMSSTTTTTTTMMTMTTLRSPSARCPYVLAAASTPPLGASSSAEPSARFMGSRSGSGSGSGSGLPSPSLHQPFIRRSHYQLPLPAISGTATAAVAAADPFVDRSTPLLTTSSTMTDRCQNARDSEDGPPAERDRLRRRRSECRRRKSSQCTTDTSAAAGVPKDEGRKQSRERKPPAQSLTMESAHAVVASPSPVRARARVSPPSLSTSPTTTTAGMTTSSSTVPEVSPVKAGDDFATMTRKMLLTTSAEFRNGGRGAPTLNDHEQHQRPPQEHHHRGSDDAPPTRPWWALAAAAAAETNHSRHTNNPPSVLPSSATTVVAAAAMPPRTAAATSATTIMSTGIRVTHTASNHVRVVNATGASSSAAAVMAAAPAADRRTATSERDAYQQRLRNIASTLSTFNAQQQQHQPPNTASTNSTSGVRGRSEPTYGTNTRVRAAPSTTSVAAAAAASSSTAGGQNPLAVTSAPHHHHHRGDDHRGGGRGGNSDSSSHHSHHGAARSASPVRNNSSFCSIM